MKYAASAVLLVFSSNDAFADAPYLHEYENGGHFAVDADDAIAAKAAQAETSFQPAHERGGHVEADRPQADTRKVAAQ